MISRAFTKDEVILALDVLYSSEKQRVSATSEEMQELSALLNRLPIHPKANRRVDFRTATGITAQLQRFTRALVSGVNKDNVGKLFFETYFYYENNKDELHQIADAIRKNEPYFVSDYGSVVEDIGFPEGILLGHLHRSLELQNAGEVIGDRCEICDLKPESCYTGTSCLLQQHLLVEPTDLLGNQKYEHECFITVCPTCHAALHRLRPWRNQANYKDILR